MSPSSPGARASPATRSSARAASSSPPTPARCAATWRRSSACARWTSPCCAPATGRSCSTRTPSSTSTSRTASTASAGSRPRSPPACARPTSCSTECGPTRPPRSAARRPSRWRPTSTSSPRRAACPTTPSARSSPATARSSGPVRKYCAEFAGASPSVAVSSLGHVAGPHLPHCVLATNDDPPATSAQNPRTDPLATLPVDRRHVRVAVARRRADRRDLVEARQVVVGQLDVERRDVLLEVVDVLRAGDRHDVIAAAQHPRERELARRGVLLGRDLADALDELQVALEVLALEARVVAAEVVLVEVLGLGEAAGQEAAAERAIGDEADPELADGREDLVLGVARPQRVLGLQRGDRVHGVRAADRLRRGLGQAEVAHLALRDELGHRADGLLDRHRLVDAVLVVQVDVVDAEALERRLARVADVLRAAVDAQTLAVLAAHVAELRREDHVVATVGDRAPDELLVGERAVHVGGVEGGDAELRGPGGCGGRPLLVGPPPET